MPQIQRFPQPWAGKSRGSLRRWRRFPVPSDGAAHLVYVGAGTSGRLGVLDAAECPPTFNVPLALVRRIIAGGEPALSRSAETSEDDPDAGARDLLASGFGSGDVLVGIAASGRTPYVLGAVAKARALGAITCGMAGQDL